MPAPHRDNNDDDIDAFRRVRAARSVPRSWQIKRVLWAAVEMTLYRWSFHTFNGWRATLLRLFGARVGRGCTIRRTSRVYYPWNLTMGPLSCLGDRAEVYDLGPVRLGARVTVSQEAYLCAGTHDYRTAAMPLVTAPIEVGDDAWVCARAFVGPGVTVGAGAIVGAAAVAMRDVPEWTIVAGNPARFIKDRPRPQTDPAGSPSSPPAAPAADTAGLPPAPVAGGEPSGAVRSAATTPPPTA